MKYRVFWEALIVSLLILALGFVLGTLLEDARNNKAAVVYLNSETNLLDAQVFGSLLNERFDCKTAIEKNIKFGDEIYQDSLKLGEYEDSSQLTELLDYQHRKYDLLRTIFWFNSIKIKDECGRSFHTVVYLYDYQSEDLAEQSKQEVFSRFLSDIKQELGNEIVLIPIAKNMNISSLDLMLEKFSVTQTAIVLDEKTVYSDVDDLDDLREKLNLDRISIPLN